MRRLSAVLILGLLIGTIVPPAAAQTTWTPEQLAERAIHRRAVEAVI